MASYFLKNQLTDVGRGENVYTTLTSSAALQVVCALRKPPPFSTNQSPKKAGTINFMLRGLIGVCGSQSGGEYKVSGFWRIFSSNKKCASE
jgi:hypothetical protein